MSSVTALAEILGRGQPVLACWCGLPEPSIAALLAREPFDAVILDMQHGQVELADALRAIPLIAALGKPAIVRIAVGDFGTASRLLDAGASGIIAPMINTVEDARRFAGFCKFPPMGERSWGPLGSLALTGLSSADYLKQSNGFSLALAMIETKEALAVIDEILAVEGIDGVFIGPADLSIGLTGGAGIDPMSPAVTDALRQVVDHTRRAGKVASMFAHSPERAGEMLGFGYQIVSVGADSFFLRSGAAAALEIARAASGLSANAAEPANTDPLARAY